MTRYFVDATGNYLGGFDGAEPPSGATEVPDAPADARQKWNNGWQPYNPDYAAIDQEELNKVLMQDGSILRAIVAVMRDEINILRTHAAIGLPARTVVQLTTALRAKMRS